MVAKVKHWHNCMCLFTLLPFFFAWYDEKCIRYFYHLSSEKESVETKLFFFARQSENACCMYMLDVFCIPQHKFRTIEVNCLMFGF